MWLWLKKKICLMRLQSHGHFVGNCKRKTPNTNEKKKICQRVKVWNNHYSKLDHFCNVHDWICVAWFFLLLSSAWTVWIYISNIFRSYTFCEFFNCAGHTLVTSMNNSLYSTCLDFELYLINWDQSFAKQNNRANDLFLYQRYHIAGCSKKKGII